MLLRLLVRSTINRARDYAAYLMACIMAIVVYFCFTAIKTDPVLSKLKSAGERLIFGGTIQIASIIIILFAAFFLAYANLFFMKKRRQEIGILRRKFSNRNDCTVDWSVFRNLFIKVIWDVTITDDGHQCRNPVFNLLGSY